MLDIVHPKLRRLYDYWDAKRAGAGRAMPARPDIDPLEITFIIGNVILVDVIPGEPLGFRIRLHGTNLAQRAGYELTGKMLDALPIPEYRALAQQSFTEVATTGTPIQGRRDRIFDNRLRRYETVILPLSSDGDRVDMLLVGLIYDDDT
jgi:hypothetical protein